MKKQIVVGLITEILLMGTASFSQATLVVYHNQADFLAQAGQTTVHDFESDTVGLTDDGYGYFVETDPAGMIRSASYGENSAAYHDFGDFTIDATGTGIYQAGVRDSNGNNDIYMCSYDNTASLNILFDNDITAFGFTYVADGNQSWDHSTFTLQGTTWDLGRPGDTGFFGVIETAGTFAAGTAFSFGQQSINWSGVRFDNITYSVTTPSPVPEPATLLLFSTGLAGLAFRRKRTK